MTRAKTLRSAQRHLAGVWLGGGLLLFLLLVVQSSINRYGSRTDEAWAWFLPTVMPSLSLIVGVSVKNGMSGTGTGRLVDRTLFHLVLGLSCVYLLMVAMVPFLYRFSGLHILDFMKRSNLWLGPLQGLVAAGMGALFVHGKGASEAS